MKKDRTHRGNSATADRRWFLKGAAITTAAVGCGVLATNAMAVEVDAKNSMAVKSKAVKTGYQETEHVRAYYKHARF